MSSSSLGEDYLLDGGLLLNQEHLESEQVGGLGFIPSSTIFWNFLTFIKIKRVFLWGLKDLVYLKKLEF